MNLTKVVKVVPGILTLLCVGCAMMPEPRRKVGVVIPEPRRDVISDEGKKPVVEPSETLNGNSQIQNWLSTKSVQDSSIGANNNAINLAPQVTGVSAFNGPEEYISEPHRNVSPTPISSASPDPSKGEISQ
jgi:hypothetical protein